MRSHYLFIFCLLFVSAYVGAQTISLSQSTNPSLIENGNVICWNVANSFEEGAMHENFFARVYDLSGDHDIQEDFLITTVEIAQWYGNDKIIDVNIYETDNLNPNQGEKILLETQSLFLIPQANENMLQVITSALIPEGKKALIEIFVPGEIDNIGSLFFLGINNNGQIRQSWIKANFCGVGSYLDPSALGFGNQEYLINISGETTLSVRDNEAVQVNLYPNPVVDELRLEKPVTTIIKNVKVIDLKGKILWSGRWVDTINFREFSSGTYIVQFESENGIFSKKILKK